MRVVVLGAGLMGAEIGAEYLAAGHDVVLVTQSERSAKAAAARAREALNALWELGLLETGGAHALGQLSTAIDGASAARGAELVVESLPEELDEKVAALRIAAAAAPDAILASNTSSLSISELGRRVGAPQRVIGTHYWNPPTLMPLVEVVRGVETAPSIVDRVVTILLGLRKEPVLVADVPGFAWNRLQFALLREATWLVTHGVADRETVDRIVRRGLGRRLGLVGPFETMALGGRDTFKGIAQRLWPELTGELPSEALDEVPLPDAASLRERVLERDQSLARLLREERGRRTAQQPDVAT
jgi:3-hydroxybutyryl-CoA dehydrogenase